MSCQILYGCHAIFPVNQVLFPVAQQDAGEAGRVAVVLLRGFSKQILHLCTRAVIVDGYFKTQVLEALEEGPCIFVRPIPDVHTCRFVEVLVVYDDAFTHLLEIHAVQISGHSVPAGPDGARRGISLLLPWVTESQLEAVEAVWAAVLKTQGGQMVLFHCHV